MSKRDWLDFEHLVDDEVRDAIKPPSMYKVILVNDDYTPMEFVIDVLQKFFSYDVERATQLMLTVHYEGKAICGVFTHMARQQWLISWELAKLGLTVKVCPWSIHAHGHGGLKPGMHYGEGGLWADGKLAAWRHHA